MYSDSLSSVSKNNTIISMGSSNPKDFSKKKRGNRSAKLKQCKLDARREQWLSQVKQKGVKEKPDVVGSSEVSTKSSRGRTIEKLEIKPREKEKEKEKEKEEIDGGSMHYSDSESSSNSPTSNISGGSDSGTIFTESSISRSNSSSCSGGCFSGSVSEDDEEEEVDDDDGGWEAIADALAASERKQDNDHKMNNNATVQECRPVSVSDTSQSKPPRRGGSVNCCAWRPDDTLRPQSLPELSKKQYGFPMNRERCRRVGAVWGCYKNVLTTSAAAVPSSCPICCEDLDMTDSSFLPCPCGFKLCLFCYKRILEEDGRCPGCRKQYDHRLLECCEPCGLISRFGRSCSLV